MQYDHGMHTYSELEQGTHRPRNGYCLTTCCVKLLKQMSGHVLVLWYLQQFITLVQSYICERIWNMEQKQNECIWNHSAHVNWVHHANVASKVYHLTCNILISSKRIYNRSIDNFDNILGIIIRLGRRRKSSSHTLSSSWKHTSIAV